MSIAIDRPSMFHEYALVRRDVSTPDVERADAEVIEVTVRWGRTVLGVAHVAPNGTLRIGEDDHGSIMIPSVALGAASFTLVDRGRVSIPRNASCEGAAAGDSIEATKSPLRFTLGEGDRAMTVHVARVAAARVLPKEKPLRKGIFAIAACSMLAHAVVVGALAFSPGASLDDDASSLDKSTQATLIQLHTAAAARETKEEQLETNAGAQTSVGGEDGGAHKGPSGMMGTPAAKPNGGAYAVEGPKLTQKEQLAATRALIESNQYGAIGALTSVFGATKGPIDMFSTFDESIGKDPRSASGNLYDSHFGDSFGYEGLGLTGTGPGGNGFNDGIGLGPVGGFGHGPGSGGPGWGVCPEGSKCDGFAVGSTVDTKKHAPTGVKVIEPGTDVAGGYPKEVVQRIVRANFPRFRQCYELGLRTDPELKGSVVTKFIIDQTGAVENVSFAGGTMSDSKVSACVVSTFGMLSFPSPENGKALVTYPIAFDHD